ncbi:MAG: ribonucleoside hydrolase RihC [Cellulosilyticaceae bacterium]
MNRRPIIIDTDPGIDDAVALAIALFSEKVDVKLITTIAGNVNIDVVTNNTLKLLKFFGKQVPVAKGATEPLIEVLEEATSVHGASGMDGYDFEEGDRSLLLEDHAVLAMRKTIMESPEKVTLVPIGPLTNIGLLLKMFPEVKANIEEIILMGGSLTRGNKGTMSEFNIANDPEAAKVVFNAGLKVTMVGLDIGWKAEISPANCVAIKELNRVGEMLYGLFQHYRGGSLKTGLRMYDATAVAYLLNPEMFTVEHTFIDVELNGSMTRGCTVVDLRNYMKREPNAYACTEINGQVFNEWFIESIKKCQ